MDDPFDLLAAGKLEGLEAVLEANPALARSRNASGASLLAWTHYAGRPEAAPLVRRHMEALDPYDAIIADDVEAIRTHLAAGWDGNALAPDGFTPLGLAAFFGRDGIFDLLLPLTRDVNERAENRQQVAAIHAATAARKPRMIENLLRAGANPDLTQADGITPLHAAAHHGDAVIVGLLILFGADRSLREAKGRTAADLAREAGHDWLAARL